MKEIRKIIAAYDATDHDTQKIALASVVLVEESSYRRVGARMLVSSSGTWVGGISGGCLEGDALKRSLNAIYQNKPSRVVYDTMDDDDNQIGVGLGCNGRIEVLFTPIDPADKDNEIEQLRGIAPASNPALMLKCIDAPAGHVGLGKTLVSDTGQEADAHFGLPANTLQPFIDEAKEKRKNIVAAVQDQQNQRLRMLVEFIRPETHLVIAGDNYDVNAMAGIAYELGWNITLLCRRKKLSKTVFDMAKMVLEYEDVAQIPVNDYTAVLLMTHDYNKDKALLPHFLACQPAYLGLLGPKKRMQKLEKELNLPGLDSSPGFFAPIGLEIGAESPEEIALAIAAEIVAHFRQKSGAPLKYKEGTIHDRE